MPGIQKVERSEEKKKMSGGKGEVISKTIAMITDIGLSLPMSRYQKAAGCWPG